MNPIYIIIIIIIKIQQNHKIMDLVGQREAAGKEESCGTLRCFWPHT